MVEMVTSINELIMVKDHLLSTYSKLSSKANISNFRISTRMCVYHGVRNVSFSDHIPYVLN